MLTVLMMTMPGTAAIYAQSGSAIPLATSQPVAIGLNEGQQHLITKVDPVYPELAKRAHIEGTVTLRATVSSAGVVERLVVIRGHPMLISSALNAVKQWQYTPFLRDGQATQALVDIEVVFSLPPLSEERAGANFHNPEWEDRMQVNKRRSEGDVLFQQKNFSQSLSSYQQELILAENETDAFYRDRDLAQAHYDVARAMEAIGNLNEARFHYERAVDVLEQARNHAAMSGAVPIKNEHDKALQPLLRDYSILLRQSGDSAAADAAQQKANSIATGMAEEQKAVDAYVKQQDQCNNLLQKTEYAKAEAVCKIAIAFSEKLPEDHWSERLTAYKSEGEALFSQKRAAESLAYYQRELAIAEKYIPSSGGDAGALRNVGRALQAMGDLQQARPYYQRAVDTFTSFCEKLRAAMPKGASAGCENQLQAELQEYALLLRQAGDTAAADEAEERAKSISEKSDIKK